MEAPIRIIDSELSNRLLSVKSDLYALFFPKPHSMRCNVASLMREKIACLIQLSEICEFASEYRVFFVGCLYLYIQRDSNTYRSLVNKIYHS